MRGTRQAAADALERDHELILDADAEGDGLREWFESLGHISAAGAAFDTRFELPAAITGRASKGIARRLRKLGCTMIVEPESFFVTRQNHLEPNEEMRARDWGAHVAAAVTARTVSG